MGSVFNAQRIGTISLGILTAGFFTGLAKLVGTLWQVLIIDPANGLASFFDSVISAILDVPTALFDSAMRSGGSFATDFGALGFLVAVALVVVAGYLVAQEVQFL